MLPSHRKLQVLDGKKTIYQNLYGNIYPISLIDKVRLVLFTFIKEKSGNDVYLLSSPMDFNKG